MKQLLYLCIQEVILINIVEKILLTESMLLAYDKLSLSLSESTGLDTRFVCSSGNNNDSSYYNGSFKSMLTTKPETSFTREISARYKISEKIILSQLLIKDLSRMF